MSDTERLEAAAAKLETLSPLAIQYGWFTAAGQPILLWGPKETHAVAALMRRVGNDADLAPHVTDAALAVADAVLGVPASPKEQAP
jgi:hypothetical protein